MKSEKQQLLPIRASWYPLSGLLVLSSLVSIILMSCAPVQYRPGDRVSLRTVAGDQLTVQQTDTTGEVHVSSGRQTAVLTAGVSGFVLNGDWHNFESTPFFEQGALHLSTSDARRLRSALSHSEPKPPKRRTTKAESPSDDAFRVVIDPGHGGKYVGAEGVYGTHEKDLNLRVARHVKRNLKQHNIHVSLTRRRDRSFSGNHKRDLDRRVQIAHRKQADLFMSIHANAARASSASGIEVLVSPDHDRDETIQRLQQWNRKSPESGPAVSVSQTYREHRRKSLRLAHYVEQKLENVAPTGSRGIKKKSLHVLRNAPCPAVLVETGFMTNSREARLLSSSSYQRKLGRAISRAVLEYRRLYARK